jgi:hypothetical protein
LTVIHSLRLAGLSARSKKNLKDRPDIRRLEHQTVNKKNPPDSVGARVKQLIIKKILIAFISVQMIRKVNN